MKNEKTVFAERGIDLHSFKATMRRLPAQVCVISSQGSEARIAMTATAVTSLSAEPPQLLICVHQQARPAAIIREAGAYCVNILGSRQLEIASQCALPGLSPEERFLYGSWQQSSALQQPMLDGAAANIVCRMVSEALHGTHWIFVGQIEQVRFHDAEPLLYHDASYRHIGQRIDSLHLEWDTAVQGY